MKHRWLYRLYNMLVLCSLPFIAIGVWVRWRSRMARGIERWSERRGFLTAEQRAPLQHGSWWWVHAVSLGEVKAIEVFLRQAPQNARINIFLTLVTPEALEWATERKLAAVIAAAPVDLPWMVRRMFRTVKPSLFISVESEFWPNLLREAKRSGAQVALVNGRISGHSYRSYMRLRSIVSALWENFDFIAVRQYEDASRFLNLGVSQRIIHVTGNMKYDLPLPERNGTSPESRPLRLVVGSSREGEEKELLAVLGPLAKKVPNLQIVWAPRHIERIPELETLFASLGYSCSRKTEGMASPVGHILWDTMGDLVEAYKQADLAIVGGSFVPKGGQNPIEPAALSLPVLFGPSMENFHGIAEVLIQQQGASQVTLPELESRLLRLLTQPEERRAMGQRARQAVLSRQGATEKTLRLLKELNRA